VDYSAQLCGMAQYAIGLMSLVASREVFCHLTCFQCPYIDDLIKELRQSGHSIYLGRVFVGCVVYADDIVLLSASYNGLQKMVNVCSSFKMRFDIRFNPSRIQTAVFGRQGSSHFSARCTFCKARYCYRKSSVRLSVCP